MATNATWTVVFDDKKIIKQTGDAAGTSYDLTDSSHDSFWNDAKFSNIWAIQFGTSDSNNEVEHRDGTPHSAYDSSVHGNFNDFITRWDAVHLAGLQAGWDENNLDDETAEQKINRIGARPTSFTSPSV